MGGMPTGTMPAGSLPTGGMPTGGMSTGGMSTGNHLGMPIRVPQANLAPQLRVRRATGPHSTVREVAPLSDRSPEATRNLMNLMQQGWQHGRVDDLEAPLGAPVERNDSEGGNGTH
jgi:hypothetical protein